MRELRLDRRQLLHRTAMFGVGGVALQTGMFGLPTFGRAAASLNTVSLYGNVSPIFDELMKAGRYYEEFGLETSKTTVSDGTKIIASLVSGASDLSTGSGFSGVFPAVAKGAKLKVLAGVYLRPQTALFAKSPDIRSSADLVGKTVAIGPVGAQLHALSIALLRKKGVDATNVKFVNIGAISDVFKAVVAGTVDAGFGTADVYFEQEKYGVHSLSDGALWNELPEYTNQAMVASDQAIAEKRDDLVKALAAHAKLFRFISSPQSEEPWIKARAIVTGKDNPREAQAQWKFFNAPGMLAADLVLEPSRFDFIQKLNVEVGVQKDMLPFEQFADMSIAQDALKQLG
ncbi:NitT/TauT family transport system substrate-binding protein [Aminobacter sp. AP02]|nr:NitT/TauT family transport system substrate-binding protein [Aminobacter sp. AP02]